MITTSSTPGTVFGSEESVLQFHDFRTYCFGLDPKDKCQTLGKGLFCRNPGSDFFGYLSHTKMLWTQARCARNVVMLRGTPVEPFFSLFHVGGFLIKAEH